MILNRQHTVRVSIAALDRFLARALRMLGLHPDSLTVCLVTSAQMARWNRRFRGKKGTTDVLSFRMDEGNSLPGRSLRSEERSRGGTGVRGNKGSKGKIISVSHGLRMISGRERTPRGGDGGAQEGRPRNGFPSTFHTRFASAASYLGDIAIAPVVARKNARRFGRTSNDELQILILHGVLHLMGYDHETDNGQMEQREHRLRRALGLGLIKP